MSWEYHGKMGLYIGPSLDHYRCLKIYILITHSDIIADTVEFIPKQIPFPNSTTETFLKQTLGDLLKLVKDKRQMNIFQAFYGDAVQNVLQELSHILQRHKFAPNATVTSGQTTKVI